MAARIRDRFRDVTENMDSRIVPGIIVIVIFVGALWLLGQGTKSTDPQVMQLTINAAATATNAQVPLLSAQLSETPPQSALTGAAPTLALSGRNSADQFAASISTSSQAGEKDWSGSQAAGPPNTSECGDKPSAWSPAQTNTQESLTAYFPELVYPTSIKIYQSSNPGFVTRVTITDVFGESHTVYESPPLPGGACPSVMTIDMTNADYAGNVVNIFVDQTSSPGRVGIDAVELVGIRY